MNEIIKKNWCRAVIRKPDFIIGDPADPYLLRWHLIPVNIFFNIYLHKFLRSDDDRALHDHPWDNCSIILWGRYIEVTQGGGRRTRHAFWPTFRKAASPHRIALHMKWDGVSRLKPIPAWSLFLTGPEIRSWGFHCPNGWVPWREFVALTEGGNQAGKGCGE